MNHNPSNSDPSLRFKFGKNWSNFLKTITNDVSVKQSSEEASAIFLRAYAD